MTSVSVPGVHSWGNAMDAPIRILMITSEWPTCDRPDSAPFIVRQANFLRSAGLTVDVFASKGRKKPFNYLRAWFQVRRKLRRDSYDLVHAQWGQSGLLAIPKHCALVITFRGSDLEGIVNSKGRYTDIPLPVTCSSSSARLLRWWLTRSLYFLNR
jgi:teichuronic acid biosynthesis glycosyltransferase TuaC